jgi:hypothetical protein
MKNIRASACNSVTTSENQDLVQSVFATLALTVAPWVLKKYAIG